MPNLFELLYNAGKGRVSHEFGVVRPYRTCSNYCTMLPKEYAGGSVLSNLSEVMQKGSSYIVGSVFRGGLTWFWL